MNLSTLAGFSPIQTRVTLSNNTTTDVQDFAAYDGQELTGFVFIDGTSDYRAIVQVAVLKTGAGTYDVAVEDVSGDPFSGSPIVSFVMSGSMLRATLPNIPGFVTAFIQYNLNAPQLGGAFPLTIDTSSFTFSIIKAGSGAGLTFQEDGGSTIAQFADDGTISLGPSASDAIAHVLNGSLSIGTVIPSFSSSTMRYVGNKFVSQTMRLSGLADTGYSVYAGAYTDGTATKRSTLNQTAARMAVRTEAAVTGKAFVWETDPSISHAADSTASLAEISSLTVQGVWTFGPSSLIGNAAFHTMNGNGVQTANPQPTFSDGNWVVGNKNASYFQSKTSQGVRLITGGYNDATFRNSSINTAMTVLALDPPTADTDVVFEFRKYWNGNYTIPAANTAMATKVALGTISGGGAWTWGPSAANAFVNPSHITYSVISAAMTGTGDANKRVILQTNTYLTAAAGIFPTRVDNSGTLGGAYLSIMARTSNALAAFDFRTNLIADSATTDSTSIASGTTAGAWIFGPQAGAANSIDHQFFSTSSTGLNVASTTTGSARVSFLQSSTTNNGGMGTEPSSTKMGAGAATGDMFINFASGKFLRFVPATTFAATAEIGSVNSIGNWSLTTTGTGVTLSLKKSTGAALSIWADLGGASNTYTFDNASGVLRAYDHSANIRMQLSQAGDMTLNSGNLIFGTSGKGIDFSATGDGTGSVSSELFNDYEEGSWTPSLTFGNLSTGITYADRNGSYTKLGRFIIARAWVFLSSKGSATGSADVTGLPYTSRNSTNVYHAGMVGLVSSLPLLDKVFMNPNATKMSLLKTDASQSLDDTNFSNSSYMVITICYEV